MALALMLMMIIMISFLSMWHMSTNTKTKQHYIFLACDTNFSEPSQTGQVLNDEHDLHSVFFARVKSAKSAWYALV